jgi:hypothetical protein
VAELEQRRRFQQVFPEHLQGKTEIAGIENLQFRLHSQFPDAFCSPAQHVRRGDIDQAPVTEIKRTAIQGTDFRQQFLDVGQPLHGAHKIGVLPELRRRFIRPDEQVSAHPRSQVDDHVGAAGSNPVDRFPVQGNVTRPLSGFRVAHVTMNDCSSGLRGVDGRPGNLFRGNGYFRVLTRGIARARNRTSDDDFKIHLYNSEYLARSWVGLILKYS